MALSTRANQKGQALPVDALTLVHDLQGALQGRRSRQRRDQIQEAPLALAGGSWYTLQFQTLHVRDAVQVRRLEKCGGNWEVMNFMCFSLQRHPGFAVHSSGLQRPHLQGCTAHTEYGSQEHLQPCCASRRRSSPEARRNTPLGSGTGVSSKRKKIR